MLEYSAKLLPKKLSGNIKDYLTIKAIVMKIEKNISAGINRCNYLAQRKSPGLKIVTWQQVHKIIPLLFLLVFSSLFARPLPIELSAYTSHFQDTMPESKVDYLERIYFSGKNKEGLNNMILETIQSLEGKNTTAAVAVQYSFLSGIKGNAENAKNACDIEQILAAGIYGIDVHEALSQNIPRPGKEATAQSGSALQAVSTISSNVSGAAVTGWYLSNGSAGYAKTAVAAYKVNAATTTVARTAESIKQAQEIFKAFAKDKPCKSVPQKDIPIGNHSSGQSETGTQSQLTLVNVTISNINYKQFSAIKTAILSGIKRVNSITKDNFYSNNASMTMKTDLKVSVLIDSIINVNPALNFDVNSRSEDDADQKEIQLSYNPDASNNTSHKTSNPGQDNTSQKQPPEDNLADRQEKDIAVQISGITYDQSKSLSTAMERINGVNSVKSSGFYGAMVSIKVHTSLSPDELIENIKKCSPKLTFEVGAATDQMIMMTIADRN